MIDKKDPKAIFNSRILHEEFDKERRRDNQFSMLASNNGEGRIARKDKTWKNIPDFFMKLLRNK